jgi:integrase
VDFSRNAHAREFGRYGVVQVRYGKAKKGSPPKRRGVLTVFTWTPEVMVDWLAHGQRCMTDGLDMFPSERGTLVAENTLLRRFRRYCSDLELPEGLDLHSLRRSYATHLIEDGWDAKFVQVLLSPHSGVHDVQHARGDRGDLRGGGGYLQQSITQIPRRFDACATGADAHLVA